MTDRQRLLDGTRAASHITLKSSARHFTLLATWALNPYAGPLDAISNQICLISLLIKFLESENFYLLANHSNQSERICGVECEKDVRLESAHTKRAKHWGSLIELH